jgi:hypothetical protein
LGVKPIQAANCRPERNSSGAGVFLHHQQCRADRTDAGDLSETSAAFIGPVPSHESGIDVVDLRLQLLVFLGLNREQLSSQGWQALVSLDAHE